MLLLKFPQFSVDIKRPAEVRLPLLVSILRKVSKKEQEKEETSLTSDHRDGQTLFTRC